MVPELEKPQVTEIQVRMDCNGCVQKIKKALHGVNGICDVYIDFPQQKLTIVGWADPEKIVKAIKKTRKMATICSHSEQSEQPPAQPTEPLPDQPIEQQAPAPDVANPLSAEGPPVEAATPPAELPKDPPPPPVASDPSVAQPAQPSIAQPLQQSRPKDVKEVQVIYYHPPDYSYKYGSGHSYSHSYGEQWNNYPNGPRFQEETSPQVYVSHNYNTYKPSPFVTHNIDAYKPSAHVTEYEYIQSPPRYTHFTRPEHYINDYHNNNGSGNISSMFSDENPNACRIV